MARINKTIGYELTIAENVKITPIFRTGSNLLCARNLAKLAGNSNPEKAYCYSISSIIMCNSAIESSLFEYAYFFDRKTYFEEKFIVKGVYKKYKMLFNTRLEKDFHDVNKLVSLRNSITHNEPDNTRENKLVNEITPEKALWAVKVTEEFVKKIIHLGCV